MLCYPLLVMRTNSTTGKLLIVRPSVVTKTVIIEMAVARAVFSNLYTVLQQHTLKSKLYLHCFCLIDVAHKMNVDKIYVVIHKHSCAREALNNAKT